VTQFTLLPVLALNLALGVAIAAPPMIGTVTANGAFRLNGDTVRSNGTLMEGAVVETGGSNLAVQLAGGARLFFSSNSRGKLFSDRIVLEQGETLLENGAGVHLEALSLTIRPERGVSTGRIGLLGSNRVRVAALTGSFRVLNARGVLVANVAAGSALAFEPLAIAAVTHVMGVLMEQSGHLLLRDQVTSVTVEVRGPGLSEQVGHMLDVTGTLNRNATPFAGATQVIAARQVRTVAAVRAGEQGREGAVAAGTGDAIGTTIRSSTVAIVGGVAAVASLGGLAAVGGSPVPPFTPPGQPPGRPPVTPPVTPPGRPPGRPPVTPPGLSR
jgi:hypothetical protein